MTRQSETKSAIPINPVTPNSGRLERIRDELLRDAALEDEMADALDCSRRSVQRLNLPYIKIGTKRIYSVSGSRKALRRQHPKEAA